MQKQTWSFIGTVIVTLGLVVTTANAGAISSSVSRHTLTPDSQQFFDQGEIPAGNILFGMTTPIGGLPDNFDTPDTLMGTFFTSDVDPGGTSFPPLTLNDDSEADNNTPAGDAFSSLFRLEAPVTDNYTVGVTGTGNFFDGAPHSEQGDYFLTVGHIDPSSLGGDFADTDGTNETLSGADVLSLGVNEAQVAVNTLSSGGGDVDFYSVNLTAGDVLSVMTAPLDDLPFSFGFPDTLIVFFDDQGNILFDDDEAGGPFSDFTGFLGPHDGQGSGLHFLAPNTGTFYFAITAYDDQDAVGDHDDFGDYGLLVSRTVPEPTSLALLVLGGLLLVRRRI